MHGAPPYTGERYVPWDERCGGLVAVPHIRRYAWATQFAHRRWVVDLGCGTGYGSYMLSWVASFVTGIDKDADSIKFATKTFESPNLAYQTLDLAGPHSDEVQQLQFMGDLYVAFEFLEHIENPRAILKRYRPLAWSVPVNDSSRFHVRPYSVLDICNMLPGQHWGQTMDGDIVSLDATKKPAYVLGLSTEEP